LGGSAPPSKLSSWALEEARARTSRLSDETSLQVLAAEIGNFRVALSLESQGELEPRAGLKLATMLAQYWLTTSAPEGRNWLETMLDRYPEPTDEFEDLMLFANAHNRLGALAYQHQDWVVASAAYAKARSFAERAGNIALTVSTRLNEGLVLAEQGHLSLAKPILIESEEYFRLEGLTPQWLLTLINLARVQVRSGNYEAAKGLLNQFREANAIHQGPASIVCSVGQATCALLTGQDPTEFLDEIGEHEATLDIHNRALYYQLKGTAAFARGDSESEAIYDQKVAFLLDEGALVNDFDLRLKERLRGVGLP
ncbi:MAG: hypothetical protein ABL949_11260, partial [Fimbriimonadaceae bacterium]